MKFAVVAMFMVFYAAFGVESKSVEERSQKPTAHSAPINSGDRITLQSAFSGGSYSKTWLNCTRASCVLTNCRNSDSSDPTRSASCPMIFAIRAKGGGVINSGDTVTMSFSPIKYGPAKRETGVPSFSLGPEEFVLSCDNSNRTKCCLKSTSNKTRARGDSLTMSKAFFQIYSRDAADGTPVENRHVVGFKYPYSSNRAWLTFQRRDRHFYPLPCSSTSKTQCAAKDKFTGFVIHKSDK